MTPNPFDPGYFRTEELREFGFRSVGENVLIAKNCTIIGLANIEIGDNVRIDGGTTFACNSGSLTIGSHIHIGSHCYLACGGGITLGDFSGLSQGVRIYSVTDDYSGAALTNPTIPREYLKLDIRPVTLEKHVIIGSGSIILPGITIGHGSSVGALSLVSKSLAEWGVYAGQPARRVKSRSQELLALEHALLSSSG
jgi:galactoside O-acetyltransferase